MAKLTVSQEVLSLLRCPKTKQSVRVANEPELAAVRKVASDESPWEGALLTEDGSIAYPIDDGYPILLSDRSVEMPTS